MASALVPGAGTCPVAGTCIRGQREKIGLSLRQNRPLSRTFPGPITAPVGLHLKPGQRGTKRLLAEYGDRLVCVRYRYDAERNKRFKTVALPLYVILGPDRSAWSSPKSKSATR